MSLQKKFVQAGHKHEEGQPYEPSSQKTFSGLHFCAGDEAERCILKRLVNRLSHSKTACMLLDESARCRRSIGLETLGIMGGQCTGDRISLNRWHPEMALVSHLAHELVHAQQMYHGLDDKDSQNPYARLMTQRVMEADAFAMQA